ncbi:MAG TPA: hypothetical protein PKO06_22230, partial [Candidatus Ozemobacteraceae bacterium]|nr:hypothetical protein [Candidatus Ozemobacteraceae bacterium]
HDENPIEDDGWYTCTWADLANNRAAAVGDRVFVGVMTPDRRRFLGYRYVTLTEENLRNGYVLVNIVIK